MSINLRELKQLRRTLGAKKMAAHLVEAISEGQIKPHECSIRDLAEGLIENGGEWVRSLDPRQAGSVALESINAIDSTAFSNVTGQLIITAMMDTYQSPQFVITQLFRTIQTRFSGERVPGIGKIGDQSQVVQEGMPYPHVGFGEDYQDTPETVKRGLIVPITKEAIFFDRTGLIIERAAEVGEALGLDKEKRCVDVLAGIVNNYNWQGTGYNTYYATSPPWTNSLSGAQYALVDWSNIDSAEALFDDIVDPNTGEPVVVTPNTLITTSRQKHTVNRILNATEIRYTGSSAPTETLAANPITGISPVFSAWLKSQLVKSGLTADQADAVWFLGDPSKAFRYFENWPITVAQSPQGSEAEFNQDIVTRYKASERGVAAVWNPRFMVKVAAY